MYDRASSWVLCCVLTAQYLPESIENQVREVTVPVLLADLVFSQELSQCIVGLQCGHENLGHVIAPKGQTDLVHVTVGVTKRLGCRFLQWHLVARVEVDEFLVL